MADPNTLKREQRRAMMLEGNVVKVIPIVALPMIISMLINSFYSMADTYFVSKLGTTATAAVGVNDSMLQLIRSTAFAFGMGASSYISRLLGAKRDEEASQVGSTTFFTALGFLAIVAAICLMFVDPIVRALGATPDIVHHSSAYASWILIGAPLTAGEVVLSQILRAEGSTTYSMVGMVSGCLVNIALDPLFIYTFDLGVAGAAIATDLSKLISFAVLLYPFLKGRTMLAIKLKYFTPKWSIYAEVARMGIPTFLRSTAMTVSIIVINRIAGSFSTAALAAVSVANKCTRLVGSAVMGFGQGFQPVAGYNWGAKNYKRVRHAFWTCSAMGATGAVVLGTVMFIFAAQIIGLFTDGSDPDIIALGKFMVRTQCATMVFHMWVMIVNGLFQALGRAIPAGLLGLSRNVICLIPAVIILSKIFGVYGLASSQAVADLLSVILAVAFLIPLLREMKKLERGETAEEPVKSTK